MEKETPYGNVLVLEKEAIFQKLAELIKSLGKGDTVALTGGSTPKAFYEWAVRQQVIDKAKADELVWMTSDERCVALESDESNFGNADRMLLRPFDIDKRAKKPWAVEQEPEDAAEAFNRYWNEHFDANKCFDLCVLGMGDDCHTTSIFPESPLLSPDTHEGNNFAAVEVPGKGWRLTVTPSGLTRCEQIIVMVTGAGKAKALKAVLEEEYDLFQKPSQIHKAHAQKTLWIVDKEAAELLS